MARRRTALFLKESVVLFGFLNGLFLALGVSPGATILETVHAMVSGLVSGVWIEFAFVALPLVLLGAALWTIWKRGRWLGFIAVLIAFLSGLVLLRDPVAGLLLLGAAFGVGVFATT